MCVFVCVRVCVCVHMCARDLEALRLTLAYALHQSPSIIEGMVCVVAGNKTCIFITQKTRAGKYMHAQLHTAILRRRERNRGKIKERGNKTRGK